MLRIRLFDKTWLLATETGYAVGKEQTRQRNGKPVTEVREVRWYPTAEAVIRDAFNEQIRCSDAQTFLQASQVAKDAFAKLCQRLQGTSFEVVQREAG